jgi:hypothetical protein
MTKPVLSITQKIPMPKHLELGTTILTCIAVALFFVVIVVLR